MVGDKWSECDGATGRRGDGARLVHSPSPPFASSPRRPVAPSPRRRFGQRGERYILQRAIGDDYQPLLAQLRCDRAEQNPAQSVRPFRSFRGVPGQARPQLGARFPGRQPFIGLARQRFDFGPFWQLEALDPGRRHGPEITALFAERVFEHQGFGVEHSLNLRQPRRLRVFQIGVARAGLADLSFDQPRLIDERIEFPLRGLYLLSRVLFTEQPELVFGDGVDPFLERAFTFEQRGVYPPADVRGGFGQHFQQAARPRAFARAERGNVMPFRRAEAMKAHQNVNKKLVMLSGGPEIRGAQLPAGELHAQRLRDVERGFDVSPRFIEIAEVALDAREVGQRRRFAAPIADVPPEGQGLTVTIERLSTLLRGGVKLPKAVEGEGLAPGVFYFAEERERPVVMVESNLLIIRFAA